MPCGCVLLAYMGLSILDGMPRALQLQINSWENRSWGIHNIDRSRTRCDVSISIDGSRMNRCKEETFTGYFIPRDQWNWHSIYLRPDNVAFRIDDAAHTVQGGDCRCTWQLLLPHSQDSECTRTAQQYSAAAKRQTDSQVLGHRVVRYRAIDKEGTEIELSLAPALGCEVMEHVKTWAGTLGIPGAKWHYRVTAYRAGEPDREVFSLPPGCVLHRQRQ